MAVALGGLAQDREKHILQHIFNQSIVSNEYRDWNNYRVKRVFNADGGTSSYPTPHDYSSNKDMTDTKFFEVGIGKKVRNKVYNLLDVDGNYTGYLIEFSEQADVSDCVGLLVFTSGSVENPGYPSNGFPRYYTTQYYNLYIYP